MKTKQERISLVIPSKTLQELKKVAKKNDRSISAQVRIFLGHAVAPSATINSEGKS